MKKSELRRIIKEEISKINETYASSFGGHGREDWGKVKDNLHSAGYDTPYKGIWDSISVEKDGVRVGSIDKSGGYYLFYPNGEYDNTPYKWEGVEQFLNHIS